MRTIAGIFAGMAGFCCAVFGAGPEFSVDGQGALSITLDGAGVLKDEAPVMVDADWKSVAEFPVATPAGREENGSVVSTWTDGASTMTRCVEALPDGRLRIVWSMRFRNGVSAARHVELDLLLSGGPRVRPVGEPPRRLIVPVGEKTVEITFAGFSIPWVFEQRLNIVPTVRFAVRRSGLRSGRTGASARWNSPEDAPAICRGSASWFPA